MRVFAAKWGENTQRLAEASDASLFLRNFLALSDKSGDYAAMSTFDVRHTQGDILVHLHDESFSSDLRHLLDETLPRHTHGQISQRRVNFLRNHSAPYPKIHLPEHNFGPLCVEVLQPSAPISAETLQVMTKLTRALANLTRP